MSWIDTYNRWNEFEALDEQLKEELVAMSDAEKEDAFYKMLDFGTAGMRGIMGVGTNRMNIYTIRKANEGFARYIESQGIDAMRRGVAIAYDSRHCSSEFARESARTLAGHGITVFLFKELTATPELSFAVRTLGAFAGIVLTASHNPKEYNGYKIYDETGCQSLPEVAQIVVDKVNEVEDELLLSAPCYDDLIEEGLIKLIGKDIDEQYNTAIVQTTFSDAPKDELSIVYTSLHGTGYRPVKKAFDTLGYEHVYYVEEQCQVDGNFTTVPFPNPEDKNVFKMAEALGQTTGADILMATDPDADRLGIAVRKQDGSYELLNGNVTGGLMTYYILDQLEQSGKLPNNGIIFTTIVSSDLAEVIADSYSVRTERTLTGFKFIGDRIEHYNKTGEYTFLYGFEESYGSLVNSDIARDKDAVQAVIVLSEMAAFYKNKGKTLLDLRDEIFAKYGCFEEGLENITLEGKAGSEKIALLISTLAQDPFTEIAGEKVIAFENYITSRRKDQHGEALIALPKSDVLKFYLEDGSWACIRPSGTEPKAKVYIAAKGTKVSETRKKVAAIKDDIMQHVQRILQ